MEFTTWRDIFQFLITVLIGLIGVPITQAFKNYFKLADKAAIILTAVISGLLAILEVFLSGQMSFTEITVKNFPEAFGLIFAVGTIYYHLMKGTSGFFGKRFMIKEL